MNNVINYINSFSVFCFKILQINVVTIIAQDDVIFTTKLELVFPVRLLLLEGVV